MYAVYAVEKVGLVKARRLSPIFDLQKRNAMVRVWYLRRSLELPLGEQACGEVNPPAVGMRRYFVPATRRVPSPAKYSLKIIRFCRNLSIGKESI